MTRCSRRIVQFNPCIIQSTVNLLEVSCQIIAWSDRFTLDQFHISSIIRFFHKRSDGPSYKYLDKYGSLLDPWILSNVSSEYCFHDCLTNQMLNDVRNAIMIECIMISLQTWLSTTHKIGHSKAMNYYSWWTAVKFILTSSLGSLSTIIADELPKENRRFSLSTFKPRHEEVSSNTVREDGNKLVQTRSMNQISID